MQTISVMINLPVPPDGWNYTGEYRKPSKGESYFLVDREPRILTSPGTITSRQFILQKET